MDLVILNPHEEPTMKQRLVIFGIGDIAQLAHFHFSRHSDYEVVAFSVDSAFLKERSFCGLPVIAFEEVAKVYPSDTHGMFIAVGYSKLNALRKEKYLAAKAMGYRLPSFISARNTFLNDARVGDNCFILEGNMIQPFATIGNNVILWGNDHIGHHSRIGDHCFIAADVVVSGRVVIGEQCFVGINAALRDHIVVGDRCVIGGGVLLLADAAEDGIYLGQATQRSEVPRSRLRSV
jgi:sugar O-acyltransferase (sialic acid O-acetyltransferase NeuD family)